MSNASAFDLPIDRRTFFLEAGSDRLLESYVINSVRVDRVLARLGRRGGGQLSLEVGTWKWHPTRHRSENHNRAFLRLTIIVHKKFIFKGF